MTPNDAQRDAGGHSGPRRLGLRAEKRSCGACLTMPAPTRVVRRPAKDRLEGGCMRGSDETSAAADGTPADRFQLAPQRQAMLAASRRGPEVRRNARRSGQRGRPDGADSAHAQPERAQRSRATIGPPGCSARIGSATAACARPAVALSREASLTHQVAAGSKGMSRGPFSRACRRRGAEAPDGTPPDAPQPKG